MFLSIHVAQPTAPSKTCEKQTTAITADASHPPCAYRRRRLQCAAILQVSEQGADEVRRVCPKYPKQQPLIKEQSARTAIGQYAAIKL